MLYRAVGTTMFLYTLTLHRSTTVYIHPGPVYFYKQLFWCQSPLRDPAVPPAVPEVAWGPAELQICSWPWSPLFAPVYLAVVLPVPPTLPAQLGYFHTYTPTGNVTVYEINIVLQNENRIQAWMSTGMQIFCICVLIGYYSKYRCRSRNIWFCCSSCRSQVQELPERGIWSTSPIKFIYPSSSSPK